MPHNELIKFVSFYENLWNLGPYWLSQMVTEQNGIGQNGTDKMVSISIDSNSTELNFYSVTTSQK